MTLIDLTGQKFGRLTVISRVWRLNCKDALWLCKCDCGNLKVVYGYHLKKGSTQSCGCLVKVHEMSYSTLYRIWLNMKDSGSDVYSEWQQFKPFYEWSMSHGYIEGLRMNRIDKNKGYSPENCRFVTKKMGYNLLLKCNGETHTMKEWSKILGVNYYTLRARINGGWTIEKTLITPVRGYK